MENTLSFILDNHSINILFLLRFSKLGLYRPLQGLNFQRRTQNDVKLGFERLWPNQFIFIENLFHFVILFSKALQNWKIFANSYQND